MQRRLLAALICLSMAVCQAVYAQPVDSAASEALNFPGKFINHITAKTASLDGQLSQQTGKYLQKIMRQERRLQKQLGKVDTAGAQRLFAGSQERYAALLRRLQQDTGRPGAAVSGPYQAYADSLHGTLAFLQQNPQLLNGQNSAGVAADVQQRMQKASGGLQELQSKLQDAGMIQQFMQQRQTQIQNYLSQYAKLPSGVTNSFNAYKARVYYYDAQVKAYKEMLNDPDKMFRTALSLLNRLPAFSNFMKSNSVLSGMFGMSGGGATGSAGGAAANLTGMATRDQVLQNLQSKLGAATAGNPGASGGGADGAPGTGGADGAPGTGGAGGAPGTGGAGGAPGMGGADGASGMGGAGGAPGMGGADGTPGMGGASAGGLDAGAFTQQQLGAVQGQLDQWRQRLAPGGDGGTEMPGFQPNGQKTKSFLHRLEYGVNLQTIHSTYYFPITTDLGLSLGYKLNDHNSIGIGASYKIGWGSDINHIHVTSQGLGLRSFLDIQIKRTWYASGGFEYNYQQPLYTLHSLRDLNNWQKSGLIGISKVISMKTKVFKSTRLQFLWDFLGQYQVPQAQPFVFRVGYTF
jgi:hypothetical protein